MKHFITSLVLIAGLSGTAFSAQAQSKISFGPRLGLNISNFSYKVPNIPAGVNNETNSIAGVQVGGVVNIDFGKVAFQPAVLFSQKGAETVLSAEDRSNPPYVSSYKVTAKPQLNYLEIPLNVVYTSGGDHGFQLFAGPYLAFGVGGSGSAKVDIESNDPDAINAGAVGSFPVSMEVEFADQQNDNASNNSNQNSLNVIATFRRFDAGLNAGVGYRIGAVQIQAGYGLGLVNFVPKDTDGTDTGATGYNRVFQFTGTYFFGKE